MQRRLLAALAAFALAVQAGEALAAFSVEEHACCCAGRGKDHHCGCPECARHRNAESGAPSLGGCSSDAGPLALANPPSAFFPAPAIASIDLPAAPSPAPFAPTPPLAPSRDVPTPPPLFI